MASTSDSDMSDSDGESVLPGSSKESSAPLGAAVAPAVLGWVALANNNETKNNEIEFFISTAAMTRPVQS